MKRLIDRFNIRFLVGIVLAIVFIYSALAQGITSSPTANVTGGSCAASSFTNSISTGGVPTCSQPALSTLSDASTVTTLTGSQVLTNKTLTAPIISTISNSGTITLPTGTNTLSTLAGAEALTNKTISGASNTLSNISNSSLTNSTVTIGSTSVALGATAATIAGLTLTSPVLNTPVLKLPSTVIGSLPTCNAGAAGTIYMVTDALLPAALATVAAGGAVIVTVFCNGTNWIVS